MGLIYVGMSVNGIGSALPPPSGTQAGDLLVVNTGGDTGTLAPSGWVNAQGNTTRYDAVFYRFADGTNTDTFPSHTGYTNHHLMAVYRGVKNKAPLAVWSDSGSISAAAYTPTVRSGTIGIALAHGGFSNNEQDWPNVRALYEFGGTADTYLVADAIEEAGVAQPARGLSQFSDGGTSYGTVMLYIRFEVNNPPTAPGPFTEPAAGSVHSLSVPYSHGAASDPDGNFSHYQREWTDSGGSYWGGLNPTTTETSGTADSSGWVETTQAAIRVRAVDTNGEVSAWTTSPFFTIDHNDAPLAPTVLSPENNAAVNLTKGVTFSWVHNDFEGDSQTGWAIKRVEVTAETAGSPEWWNEEWWDEANAAWVMLNYPGAPQDVVNTGTNTSTTISVWPDAKRSYLFTIATRDAGSNKLGAFSEWRTLNPFMWWNESTQSWVYTEHWNASATTQVTIPASALETGVEYYWTVATGD